MNNNLVTIVALSVDSRQAVLYFQDGSTLNMEQGDARLPGIVKDSKELLSRGLPAVVDITPLHIVRTEFGAAEKGTGGVIKFFKVAKSLLKKLINTDSPKAVPEEVAYVSPLSIGVFPGQEALNQGTKEESEAKTEDLPDLSTDEKALAAADEARAEGYASDSEVAQLADKARAQHEQEVADANATTSLPIKQPTNAEKLAAAQERLSQIVGNGHGTEKAEFHTPLDEKTETIVAIHTTTGAIVPDAQKLARHLRQSEKLQNYVGFERFIERLSAIIDQRGHSVEDLMKFIEHGDLPIADDGCIVIYKKLNRGSQGTFVDVHSGKIRQKVGSYVYLLPHLVDPNRRNSCSNGLHVGVMSYVKSFSGNVMVMAKLRPEDVFAVPEYEHTKMRVAGYHILSELPDHLRELVNKGVSISAHPDGAILLNKVLRGEHIGITQHVEVGGHNGTNVTYTDTGADARILPATLGYAQALDMVEELNAKLPTAPSIKPDELVEPKPEVNSVDEDEDMACTKCGADTNDGEGFDGLCGNCADAATRPEPPADESTLKVIMSNDPKETLGEVANKTVQTEGKLSQKEKAAQLLLNVRSAMTFPAEFEAAKALVEFRRSTRKGWAALGIDSSDVLALEKIFGVAAKPEAKPVNAPKPVKAPSKGTKKAQKAEAKPAESPQDQAYTLLAQGLSNIEVAKQTGLSKDQVYRLKKKLAA